MAPSSDIVDQGDWTLASLGDVVQRVSDTVKFTGEAQSRLLPDGWYVGLEHIEGGAAGTATPVTLADARDLRSGKLAFARGDILYGKLRPYLNKVWLADRDGICSTEIIVLRSRGVDTRYLRHYLASRAFVEAASARQRGSSLPRAAWSDLATIQIPLPPTVAEQARIADLLDEALSVQRLCNSQSAEVDQLLDATFLHMFGASGEAQRRWPSSTIEAQDVEVLSGLQVSPGRVVPSGVPYLRVANVQRRHVDLGELKYMQVSAAELRTKGLRRGDVLVVEGHGNPAELGRSAVWYQPLGPVVHQNHIIRLRILRDNLTPEYLSEYINSLLGRAYFESIGRTTSGLNTISVRDLSRMPIQVPPLEIQQRFAERVRAAMSLREDFEAQKCEAETLYHTLVEGCLQSRSVPSVHRRGAAGTFLPERAA